MTNGGISTIRNKWQKYFAMEVAISSWWNIATIEASGWSLSVGDPFAQVSYCRPRDITHTFSL